LNIKRTEKIQELPLIRVSCGWMLDGGTVLSILKASSYLSGGSASPYLLAPHRGAFKLMGKK
jgi:hypothetical protein